MNSDADRYRLLAALKGPAIKCVIAFCWERRQLTVNQLVPRVGHDKNTVRVALAQLALYNLAAQVIGTIETWTLTDIGYQLPLPPMLEGQTLQDQILQVAPSGEILTLTTTTTYSPSSSPLDSCSSSKRNNGEILTTEPDDPDYEAALQALHKHNIRGPKAEELAHLEWMTPEYIKAHVEALPRKDLGLAIYRMTCGDEPPEPEHSIADTWRYVTNPLIKH